MVQWACALSGQRLGFLHRERKRKSGDEFTAIRMLSWGATQSSIKRSLRFAAFARSLLGQLLRGACCTARPALVVLLRDIVGAS